MTVIAVAGGTGGLGRAIVETLTSLNQHDVLVLSRNENPEFECSFHVRVIAVDYTDINSLKTSLEGCNVHTVICTVDTRTDADSHVNCIRAAELSTSTKRFIPSVFATPLELANRLPSARHKHQALEELKKTSLEYTLVYNVVDVKWCMAAIPGSGNVPVVFSHTFDVAKFVGALLTLEKWPLESYIMGDKMTWNQFLQLAEEVRGTKFDVVYDAMAKLEQGEVTLLPSQLPEFAAFSDGQVRNFLAGLYILFENGTCNFNADTSLNDLFPEIKTWTVRKFLETAWKNG